MKTSGEQEKLYLSRGSFSEGKNGKQNYSRFVDNNQRRAFSRSFLKAKALGILIAWVTENRKINKKPNSVQEETSETYFSFSNYQIFK